MIIKRTSMSAAMLLGVVLRTTMTNSLLLHELTSLCKSKDILLSLFIFGRIAKRSTQLKAIKIRGLSRSVNQEVSGCSRRSRKVFSHPGIMHGCWICVTTNVMFDVVSVCSRSVSQIPYKRFCDLFGRIEQKSFAQALYSEGR